ncbi:unnamed protein product [Caenorhabditis angaria]|uniref:Methyltransferase FkbM domain-containing protein n=1 Tax=Caenorhabditis angaria TaxID=860376 RepID=A0A9P1I8M6_9PELO|nr:unnamed protein product [Caenorhabditis angaria]
MYSNLELKDRKISSNKIFILIAFSIAVLIYFGVGAGKNYVLEEEKTENQNQVGGNQVLAQIQNKVAENGKKAETVKKLEIRPEVYGYNGPRSELDDFEMEVDSARVAEISKSVQELINSTQKCDFNSESELGSKIAKSALQGFQKCIKPVFDSFNGDSKKLFDEWVTSARKCDFIDEFKNLDIRAVANRDEIKWLIYPKCQEENNHVTLGIGHDVTAELKLKKHQPNTKFYGVDPMIDINYELITDQLGGSFFAFALANETKIQYFPVLPKKNVYGEQAVATLDVGYFFEKLLTIKKIDTLFLDIEGGEHYFYHYFAKGGKFDEIGLKICQFNIELHPGYTKNYEAVYRFFEQTIKDGRYIFMRPALHTPGFFKMYFLNVENQECVRKFMG